MSAETLDSSRHSAKTAARLARSRRRAMRLVALGVGWVLIMLISLSVGAVHVPVDQIAGIVASRIPLLKALVVSHPWDATAETIVLRIRLPRVVLSGIVGASLALAGSAMQGLFRNPMADPFVLGIAPGASLGAVIAFALGLGFHVLGVGAVPLFAFAGALGTTFLVYLLARGKGGVPVATLLLVGIALGSLLSALVSLVLVFHEQQITNVMFWLLGSLSRSDWQRVLTVLPYFGIGLVTVFVYARDLNAMLLGEEDAQHLGVEVERVKRRLLVATSLLTAAAVSVSGIIGFVGLMIPHIVRLLIGPDHRLLAPMSVLTGAAFLTGVDTIARTAIQPTEIPVGALTALFGGPFFLFLLKRQRLTM